MFDAVEPASFKLGNGQTVTGPAAPAHPCAGRKSTRMIRSPPTIPRSDLWALASLAMFVSVAQTQLPAPTAVHHQRPVQARDVAARTSPTAACDCPRPVPGSPPCPVPLPSTRSHEPDRPVSLPSTRSHEPAVPSATALDLLPRARPAQCHCPSTTAGQPPWADRSGHPSATFPHVWEGKVSDKRHGTNVDPSIARRVVERSAIPRSC